MSTQDSGLYVVLIDLARPVRVRWAARTAVLPPGRYAYVGSARRALLARAQRHLRRRKARKWHVDQLTTHRAAATLGALLLPLCATTECTLNRRVGELVLGLAYAPGFGASDCRAGCPAHLWYCRRALGLTELASALGADLVLPLRRRVSTVAD